VNRGAGHIPDARLQARLFSEDGASLKMFAIVTAVLIAWGSLFMSMPVTQSEVFFFCRTAHAQETWRKEFEDICSKTQDAMGFSAEELKSLVLRCDALRPLIEKLDEPQRKVTLRRLQMCRDLYAFVLETKEAK
jgi:hypothetical protein